MIHLENLTFSYTSGQPIFSDFSLSFEQGESWSIIGPSGCGKSTLLFMLAGLTRPKGGRVVIAGKEISRPRPETGLVLQNHGLLPWATVQENVMMGYTIRNFYGDDGVHSPAGTILDKKTFSEKADYWLEWLGLADHRLRYPRQLSRGQGQRAAIARTLVLEPDLLLMDEPFSALDAPVREDLQSVMNSFHRESKMTSITVTHDIEEAVVLGEKILVLGDQCSHKPQIVTNEFYGKDRENSDFRTCCARLRQLLTTVGDR